MDDIQEKAREVEWYLERLVASPVRFEIEAGDRTYDEEDARDRARTLRRSIEEEI